MAGASPAYGGSPAESPYAATTPMAAAYSGAASAVRCARRLDIWGCGAFAGRIVLAARLLLLSSHISCLSGLLTHTHAGVAVARRHALHLSLRLGIHAWWLRRWCVSLSSFLPLAAAFGCATTIAELTAHLYFPLLHPSPGSPNPAGTPGGATPAAATPGATAGTPSNYFAESASPGSAAGYGTPGGYGADGADMQEEAEFTAGTCVSLTSGDEGVVSTVRGSECTVLVDGSYVDAQCESLTFVRPKKGDKVRCRERWDGRRDGGGKRKRAARSRQRDAG